MRFGELLKLEWTQVDWEKGLIEVVAMHTKTMERRIVPITARLKLELAAWRKKRPATARSVFGISFNVSTAWRGVRDDAAMVGLRFHDLRHTFASRALAAGVPAEQVGRILGHKNSQTTYRYLNVDEEVARGAAKKMDRKRRAPKKAKASQEVRVN